MKMLPWFYEGNITVPKNAQGNIDCDQGLITDNVEVFYISPSEYDKLTDYGVITELNLIDGVFVDRFESDYIPFDKLSKCLK